MLVRWTATRIELARENAASQQRMSGTKNADVCAGTALFLPSRMQMATQLPFMQANKSDAEDLRHDKPESPAQEGR